MLVWINGTFGVGKTQVAHEIQRRLPGAFVSNPEHLGFGLHRMLPPAARGDFQELPLWRTGVRQVLDGLLSRPDGVVLVPMTMTSAEYHTEIIGGLTALGHDVHHVTLMASADTVHRRLRSRGEGKGSYAAGQLRSRLDALAAPEFARHVPTDGKSVPQVADDVAALAGLTLTPSTGGKVVQLARQWKVTVRNIRFD